MNIEVECITYGIDDSKHLYNVKVYQNQGDEIYRQIEIVASSEGEVRDKIDGILETGKKFILDQIELDRCDNWNSGRIEEDEE